MGKFYGILFSFLKRLLLLNWFIYCECSCEMNRMAEVVKKLSLEKDSGSANNFVNCWLFKQLPYKMMISLSLTKSKSLEKKSDVWPFKI